jgi:hypothetical protein
MTDIPDGWEALPAGYTIPGIGHKGVTGNEPVIPFCGYAVRRGAGWDSDCDWPALYGRAAPDDETWHDYDAYACGEHLPVMAGDSEAIL